MNKTRNIHDGIVGLVITLGVVLGFQANAAWFWLPGIILQRSSPEVQVERE